jgi:hypothetical protein
MELEELRGMDRDALEARVLALWLLVCNLAGQCGTKLEDVEKVLESTERAVGRLFAGRKDRT